MNILGIETSCDETAVAIVTDRKAILADMLFSQKEHNVYGGVVPEVAARAHLHHLDGMIEAALEKTGIGLGDLDGVAVTAGPGLIGGVMVGVMTAKAVAAVRGLPIVAVNHLEGHALSARLTEDIAFPYLLLLVSGGHCQILVVEGIGQYRRLGGTIDDAVGEAFDKTAKLLGLGYPGGPAIEKMAASCNDPARAISAYPLPRPLFGTPGCDFSFSGLKTAVRRMVEKTDLNAVTVADICQAFQKTVTDILSDRVRRAIDMAPGCTALVVAGGVAANKTIRAVLESQAREKGLRFAAPPLRLCTDNAAMIAWAGIERLRLGLSDPIDFPVYARWPLDPGTKEKHA